ncbi:hypothetical protein ACI2UC_20365 [Ralstonia nicotianae]
MAKIDPSAEYLPSVIAKWLAALPQTGKSRRYFDRAKRFERAWRDSPDAAEKLLRAWRTLERAAVNEDALLTLFIVMPDAPDDEPFPLIFGRRNIDAKEEKDRYMEMRGHAVALAEFLGSRNWRHLASDCGATGGEALGHYSKFRNLSAGIVPALRTLAKALEHADPSAKLINKQATAGNRAEQNYLRQLAELNSYLCSPKHAALSYIAAVNCPDHPIDSNRIQKIWKEREEKNP